VLGSIKGLLLFSTLVCGLWTRGQDVVEMSSRNFHRSIGVATVIAAGDMTKVAVLGVLRPA
jgi:hypothetical protein